MRSAIISVLLCLSGFALPRPPVTVIHTPGGGIQPQVVKDSAGVVHLVYYTGDPANGDLFYTRSMDDGNTWTKPTPVNQTKGDAIAIGNIRGAQLAVGRNGIVHVTWIGSKVVPGQPSDGGLSVLYSHSLANGSFATERSLQGHTFGIDGGDTVAADDSGHVAIVWHAADSKDVEEKDRKLYIALSSDDGTTFAPEHTVWNRATGACGCCSCKALFAGGKLWVAYRGAQPNVNRSPYLLRSIDLGGYFYGQQLSDWVTNVCPMSTFSLFALHGKLFVAWERQGVIQWSGWEGEPSRGIGDRAKYPVVIANGDGEVLVAWTEGMTFGKGGDLCWQVYDRNGLRVKSQNGRAPGVPANSLVSAWVRNDGSFALMQ